MSKRAEEKALEMYPPMLANCIAFPDSECVYFNTSKRQACQTGYEQAEKDLALTWEDIKRIVKIADDLIPDTPFVSVSEQIFADEFQTEESYYQEVLKRFNDGR